MKSEETIINQQDENTTLDETVTQTTAQQTTATEAEAPQKRKGEWKKVAVGAGVGLLFGSAATFFSSAASGQDVNPAGGHGGGGNPNPEVPEVDDSIAVATCVDDEMSFSQAFAAARAEVGPGGAFEWRGNLYNTYTAEEWDGMTAEERADYNEHFSWVATDEPLVAQADDASGEVEVAGYDAPQQEQGQQDTAQDAEVDVLGVEHDAETGANLAYVRVDGQDAVLVDVDGDNTFDGLVADVNQDGQITDNEIVDISQGNITVDDLGGFTHPGNDVYYASNGELDYAGGDAPLEA